MLRFNRLAAYACFSEQLASPLKIMLVISFDSVPTQRVALGSADLRF